MRSVDGTTGQDMTGGRLAPVLLAKVRDRLGAPLRLFCSGRVEPLDDIAEQALRLGSCEVGRPRRAVLSNGVPALFPAGGSIFQNIGDGRALLAACAKPATAPFP